MPERRARTGARHASTGASHGARPGGRRDLALGQHFLRPEAADAVVRAAEVRRGELVVELGAGSGVLTGALVEADAVVVAVELDPGLCKSLARRFAGTSQVTLVEEDALGFDLPAIPVRVVANLPFGHTSAFLHRPLDDLGSGLQRADLVVQWQVARERVRASPGPPMDLKGALWGPWWSFRRGRRLAAASFVPRPSVDAAVLVVERRSVPLLDPGAQYAYAAWARARFDRSARAESLDVAGWVRLFLQRERRAHRRGRRPR